MPTLKEIIAAKQAQQAQQAATPVSKPKDTFASLAEIIKRQQNAKVSAGDKELAQQRGISTKQQANHVAIAKAIMNSNPEIIIGKAINEEEKKVKAGQLVAAPKISLKGLIAAGQQKFEQQFEQKTNTTVALVPKFDEEGNKIFEYDESQVAAVKGMVRNQFACLIGSAGTGKSKTVNDFLTELEENNQIGTIEYEIIGKNDMRTVAYKPSIWIGSFTGRAVEMVKTKIDPKYHPTCGTIHGETCLAYQPDYYDEIDEKDGLLRTKMRFIPSYNEFTKLPYTIYIIDEAGMLSVDLWNTLKKAMLPNARVYLVGDINQLPPVYGRSILGFGMLKWPTFELTKIHRQAANNPIIANAHRILRGEMPLAVKEKFDMQNLGDVGSNGAQQKTLAIVKHLHKKGSFNEYRDGFIVPQNKGPIGKDQFNELLTPYFNPDNSMETKRYLIKTGISMVHFARGDKIMLLANDKQNNLTNGQIGIVTNIAFNGAYQNMKASVTHTDLTKMHSTNMSAEELGDFELEAEDPEGSEEDNKKNENERNLRQASHIVTARFGEFSWEDLNELNKINMLITANYIDSKLVMDFAHRFGISGEGAALHNEVMMKARDHARILSNKLSKTSKEVTFSTAGEFRLISHAYCFTCHKSQGGEYPVVVILIHSANAVLLSREWFYTAVTRAQNRIVLVYNERGLMQALRTQRIKGTTLQEKIKSFFEVSAKDAGNEDAIIPNLPEPKELVN